MAFALQLAVLQVLATCGIAAPLANLLGNASAMAWNVVISTRWTWRVATWQ